MSPTHPPPLSPTSGERERLAAADASHLVGIGIYQHQPASGPDAVPAAQPTVSKHWRKVHSINSGQNCNYTSLSAVGSETHENVMSQAWTTSDGVLPCSAPSRIKSRHCTKRTTVMLQYITIHRLFAKHCYKQSAGSADIMLAVDGQTTVQRVQF